MCIAPLSVLWRPLEVLAVAARIPETKPTEFLHSLVRRLRELPFMTIALEGGVGSWKADEVR